MHKSENSVHNNYFENSLISVINVTWDTSKNNSESSIFLNEIFKNLQIKRNARQYQNHFHNRSHVISTHFRNLLIINRTINSFLCKITCFNYFFMATISKTLLPLSQNKTSSEQCTKNARFKAVSNASFSVSSIRQGSLREILLLITRLKTFT